jgi:hypothetical protein
MLFLLAHGHQLLAFQENALAMALLPVVVYALVRQVRGAGWVSVSTRSAWALTAVVLVFGVARNIPVAPFSELAPRAF